MSRTFTGFTPYKHQKDVLDIVCDRKRGKGAVVTVKSKRQVGKSFMCLNLLLYYAINKSISTSALISITLAQSRKVFKELVNAIEGAGIIKKKNEQTLELELVNCSKIIFKSSEQGTDSLRGYTINGVLILDEASFLSEDILQAVLPWINVHQAPLLLVSTPKFKNCFFYRYYMMGLDDAYPKYYSFDWNEYDLSKFLTVDKLKEMERILPKNQFKTEYLGEFLDDDGVVFDNFKDCIKQAEIRPYDRLYIGIDWGSGNGNDSTVISGINDKGEQVLLERFNDLNTSSQISRVSDILNKYKAQVGLVLSEKNSIGTPLTEMVMEKCPNVKIEMVTTTNTNKGEMVAQLQVAFQNKEISILDNDVQTNEIASYEAVYNPKTRNVSYNAPLGLHDDTVMALMYAYKAYKEKNKRGNYAVR